jgi:tetratricopeptide (TPR) repeat protein
LDDPTGTPHDERPPIQERVRNRLLRRFSDSDREVTTPRKRPQGRRISLPEVRLPLVLTIIGILGGILLFTLVVQPRLLPRRPHRLTIAVADLSMDAGMVSSREGEQASRDLLSYLQERMNQSGHGETILLKLVNELPPNEAAAYELAQRNNADLLLWGWVDQLEPPRYFLDLALVPKVDAQVPEFEDYFLVMMTPHNMALTNPNNERGLSPEDLAEALIWLSQFYLGEFDEMEQRPLGTMQRPALASEVMTFHWASLSWLKGSYSAAQATYDSLIGNRIPPVCPERLEPSLCAAAFNNKAVVLLTRESLGELPPTWLDQAIILLESATQDNPRSPTAKYNLGRAAIARGQWDKAIAALEPVAQQNRRHAPARAALSEAYRQKGGSRNLNRAKELANSAAAEAPERADGQLAVGRYLLAVGDTQGATRALERAREVAEGEKSRRRSRESALLESPQPNPRRAEYTRAWTRRADPLLAEVHLAWAELYFLLGKQEGDPSFLVFLWRLIVAETSPWDSALAEVQQALDKHPNWYEAYYLRGEIHQARANYEQAIAAFEMAKKQDPRNPRAYIGTANVRRDQWRALRRANQEEEAQQQFMLAQLEYNLLIMDNIDPAQGYFGLGQLSQEAERLTEASANYRLAVEVDPDYAEAYLRLGQVEIQLGNNADALFFLDQAIETAGSLNWIRVTAHVEKGEHYIEQYLWSKLQGAGQKELLKNAQAEFELALQQNPSAARALTGLGRIAYEEGRNDQALASFQQVINQNRYNFAAAYGIGRVYEAEEKSRLALEYLSRAVEIRPNNIAAQYHLGVAYYSQLKEAQARQAFLKVQSLCERSEEQGVRKADDQESCWQVPARLERLNNAP